MSRRSYKFIYFTSCCDAKTFYHGEDSHSIWPCQDGVMCRYCTTQASEEICEGPRQAQAQTVVAEVRGQPLRKYTPSVGRAPS